MSLTRREFLKLSGAVIASLPLSGYAAANAVKIPVLLYRDISAQRTEEGTVSPSLFATQMEWLYNAGYRAVFLEELDSLKAEDTGRAVVITFDGGYASFMDYAFPLFTEYGFKSTIAIIGNHAGGFAGGYPLLSWDECRLLVAGGLVGIGYHAYDLPVRSGNRSRAAAIAALNERLQRDLSAFQEISARELGRPATILSWPGGYDDNSIRIAKRAGFHHMLGSDHRYAGHNNGSADVPRFTIDNGTPLPLFRKIVERSL